MSAIDPARIRSEFPAMERLVHQKPLVYLDTASTAQKPRVVLEAMARAARATANVHRGVHQLSVEATRAYESSRVSAAKLIGAARPEEIIFVRGATEGINLLAQTHGRARVSAGDEVLVTVLEHHSNLVPWQMLCAEKGARLRALPLDANGDVELGALDDLLGERTRIVALSQASNSVGTVVPVRAIADRARRIGATVIVDGAQGVVHGPTDVNALGCDFYVFSGHKLYGPTGTGVVWGRTALLEAMPPWQGGGDMVEEVTLERATYRPPPHRFEAGTPNIVGVIGLGAALEWFMKLGPENVAAHDRELLAHAHLVLGRIPDLHFVGAPRERVGVVSFLLGDHHPHDVGTACDGEGVAIRAGHHCAQPLMDHFGVAATARASFGVYTTPADIDRLELALHRARDILGGDPVKDAAALYQALLLDHGTHPRREGPLDGATHESRRANPLCGDRVTLRLRVEDGVLRAVRFEARGCLLAKASASILGNLVEGRTAIDALAQARTLHALARDGVPPSDVGPLEALRPVREFSARISCVELAWDCLEDALTASAGRPRGP